MSTIEFEGVNLGATPEQFLHGMIRTLRGGEVKAVVITLEDFKLSARPIAKGQPVDLVEHEQRPLSPREALREKQTALAGEPVGPESIAPDRAGDEGRSGEGLSLNELQAAAEQAEAANLLRDADALTKPDES